MTTKHYNQPNRLTQLLDEILSAIAEAQPVNDEAVVRVEGKDDDVYITMPDDTSSETWAAIDQIVAAHVPAAPAPAPKWDEFRAIATNKSYLRIVTTNPQTQAMNAPLTWMVGEVGRNPDLLSQVANLWNAIAQQAQPTSAEIADLNQLAASCNVPFMLNSQGLISYDTE